MTEDVKGIPDVAGLSEFIQGTVEQPVVKATSEAPKAEEKVDLGQFKKPEDLLKSYKEIQGYTTKVSQENKALQEKLATYEEQMRMLQMQQQYQQPPAPQPPPQDFDTQFINNPKQAIDNVVNQRVNETIRTMTIQDILQEESAKNPQEFRERYNYAMSARQMYPNLVNSSQGVRMLFQIGDKARNDDLKRNAEKSVKMLFGEDVDFEKFKKLVSKDQQLDNKQSIDLAYMPDGSGAFRTGTEPDQVTFEKSISSAVDKGDVDTVLSQVFRQQMRK